MTLLADSTIAKLCTGDYQYKGDPRIVDASTMAFEEGSDIVGLTKPMIDPFVPCLVRERDDKKIISYGLSSYGYDVRLAGDIKLFTNVNSAVVDPMKPSENCYVDAEVLTDENGHEYFLLPPNSYALGHTIEVFSIPRNVMAVCLGKSTYARSALLVNVTPIEPGFEGQVVIEVGNGSNLPVKVYLGVGIAQFMFYRGNVSCETSYGDRGGKYQHQRGITLSRV